MKFGAFFLLGSPLMLPSEEMYARVSEWAVLAEELGYDSVWFAEHQFSSYGYIPNPLLMANGRLEVGVARGYQPYEFARFGVDMEDNRARTDEALEVLLLALTEDGFEYRGRRSGRPRTRRRVSLWPPASVCSRSPRPLEVLEEGWGSFQETRRARGLGGPADFAVQQQLCVAPTDGEAKAQMRDFLYALRQVGALRGGTQHVVKGYSEPLPIQGEPSLDEIFENRTLAGSPTTVRRKLARYQERNYCVELHVSARGNGAGHGHPLHATLRKTRDAALSLEHCCPTKFQDRGAGNRRDVWSRSVVKKGLSLGQLQL